MVNDKNRNYGQPDRNSQNEESQSWANTNDAASESMNAVDRMDYSTEDAAENKFSAESLNTEDKNSWSSKNVEEARIAKSAGFESGTNPDRYQNLSRDMDTDDESEKRGATSRNYNDAETRTPGL